MSVLKLVCMLLLLQKKFNTNVSHFFSETLCTLQFSLCTLHFAVLFDTYQPRVRRFLGRVMVYEFAQVGIYGVYAFAVAKKIQYKC